MPREFRCTNCYRLLRVPDDASGRPAVCPACGTTTTVPGPETPLAQPPPGAAEPAAPARAPGAPEEPSPQTTAENPFQSPGSYGSAAPPMFDSVYARRYAESRVSGPSTWLIVTGAVGVPLKLIGIVVYLVTHIFRMNQGAGGPFNGPAVIFSPDFGFLIDFISLGLCFVVIYGGARMKNLENYGLAMTAAIVAMIPWISPCCLFGLPFGIWALVVLGDSRVKAAFRQ